MYLSKIYLILSHRQILDSSNFKQCADNNSEFDINDGKFSKREENAVGNGEIAHYEQFLLFPLNFQNTFLCLHEKQQGLVW